MERTENAGGNRLRRLRALLSGLAVVAAVAALASPAAAEPATAVGMSIAFPAKTASVSGPGALVLVRCAGVGGRECTGTLTVEGLSESHSASYSVGRGEKRSLVVPLGAERGFFTGIASPKMKVVAETLQSTGSSLRTARVLRFK